LTATVRAKRLRSPLFALATVVLFPASLHAHGVHLSAHAHGKSIHGRAFYHGDLPAKNAKITAFDSAEKPVGETRTDQQGKFTLKVPALGNYRLLADTGGGHGAETRIEVGSSSGDRPSGIEKKIVELQRQLEAHERQTRLRDILGGIGYILGVAGIAFYLLGRRRGRSRV